MKRRGAWFLSAGLGLSAHASAENKLFITDVLDRGQFETEATLQFTKTSQYDFTFPSGTTGTGTRRTSRLFASLGGGVVDGFQIDATIPYAFVDMESDTSNGVTRDTDRSGVGDLDVGFKARLAGAERGPSVASLRLDIKPQTADSARQGTGSTDYTLELAGSLRVGETLRPYGALDATYRTNNRGEAYTIRVGAEKVFGEQLVATLEANASKNTEAYNREGYTRTGISVSVYLQTARNLYVIPALEYSWYGEIPGRNGFASVGSQSVTAASIGLYYLF